MQVSSSSPPSSRQRARSDDAATAAKPKKARARKAPIKPEQSHDSPLDTVALHAGPAELTDRIATAAYFIAAERNFTPGRELDDWLEAERRVRSLSQG